MQPNPSGEGGQDHGGPEKLTPARLKFEVAFESVGKTVNSNEDKLLYMPEAGVLAAFDALGGNEATRTHDPAELVRVVVAEGYRDAPITSTAELEQDRLKKVVVAANETLYLENMEKGIDLASTLALARMWLAADGSWQATIASVGDSRVYRFRAGKLQMLTLDHSLQSMNDELSEEDLWKIQEHLANFGDGEAVIELTAFEQSCFEARKGVGHALGFEATPDPRILDSEVLNGDILLVMGDGPSDNLTTYEMEKLIAKGGNAEEIVKRIIRAAVERSHDARSLRAGPDDMTVLAAIAQVDTLTTKPE